MVGTGHSWECARSRIKQQQIFQAFARKGERICRCGLIHLESRIIHPHFTGFNLVGHRVGIPAHQQTAADAHQCVFIFFQRCQRKIRQSDFYFAGARAQRDALRRHRCDDSLKFHELRFQTAVEQLIRRRVDGHGQSSCPQPLHPAGANNRSKQPGAADALNRTSITDLERRNARRLAQRILFSLLRISRRPPRAPHCGVITDRYTLAHFYAPDVDCWELFDRAKDAGEMRNVFGEPAYAAVQTNLLEEVSHLRTELKEPPTDDPKAFGRATEF